MPRPARPAARQRGFTLIEMIVVMALLAIITGIAAPGLSEFLAGQRVKAAAFDLTSDLLLARSEALKRGRTVTVVPVDGDWRAGWSARDGDQEFLRRNDAGQRLAFDGAPSQLSFNVSGRLAAPAGGVRVTVRSDDAAEASKRCVVLDLAGRARTQLGACS